MNELKVLLSIIRPVSTQSSARCDQGDLLFYKFCSIANSIAQYYDHRRTKCVRLVVEPDSTPTRDILVAPIRFIINVNKLHFAEPSALSQWKLKGE